MIKNLPSKIQASALQNFNFGDADARTDSLLPTCHVPTSSLAELIADQKDIVLGHRGTGKSAMVRLIDERVVQFRGNSSEKNEIIVVDDEYDYSAIKSHLLKNALKDSDEDLVFRAVWEVLIIHRILRKVKDCIPTKDAKIDQILSDIETLLGTKSGKAGLFEILLSHKKKVGVKFDSYHPNIVDAYIGLEPTSDTASSNGSPILQIGEYRRYIDQLLQSNSIRLYVLLDRLDDFVIREQYDAQKKLLQALLSTQQIYREKSNFIRIKVFFRTDLFERLNLSQYGADKILVRCIHIQWTKADIKRLIAQRIGYNLSKALSLKGFEFEIDNDRFYISRDEFPMLEKSKSMSSFNPFKKADWIKLIFLATINLRKNSHNSGRITDSMEVIHEEIITSIFPREVLHQKTSGEKVEIDIFKFLETHLQFANGETTPRAVLSFMQKCLEKTKDYYLQNTDITELERDKNHEFPLFVKTAIYKGYNEFRKQCWTIQYQWAQEWKNLVACIESCSLKGTFSFLELAKSSKCEEAELRQFLAFVSHTGLISCDNPHAKVDSRTYRIPILFRKAVTRQVFEDEFPSGYH